VPLPEISQSSPTFQHAVLIPLDTLFLQRLGSAGVGS
jgi:hypothetical protein